MFGFDVVAHREQRITLECEKEDCYGPANCSREEWVIKFTYQPLARKLNEKSISFITVVSVKDRESYRILASEVKSLLEGFLSLKNEDSTVAFNKKVVVDILRGCRSRGMRVDDDFQKLYRQVFPKES